MAFKAILPWLTLYGWLDGADLKRRPPGRKAGEPWRWIEVPARAYNNAVRVRLWIKGCEYEKDSSALCRRPGVGHARHCRHAGHDMHPAERYQQLDVAERQVDRAGRLSSPESPVETARHLFGLCLQRDAGDSR